MRTEADHPLATPCAARAALMARGGLSDGADGSPTVRAQPLSSPVAMQGIGSGPAAGAAMAAANVSNAARRISAEGDGPGLPDGGGPSPGRSIGSAGGEGSPYVSTFGSLPSQLAGSSDKASGAGACRKDAWRLACCQHCLFSRACCAGAVGCPRGLPHWHSVPMPMGIQ